MINTLGVENLYIAAARTILFSTNVPVNETWLILNLRTNGSTVALTTVELRINQDPRIKAIPSQRNNVMEISEEIPGGTNIELHIVKNDAVAQTIGAFIDIDRIKSGV